MLKQLLDNAIEALPRKGAREIEVTLETADDRVSLSVTDTGGGIPEPLRLKVFEPFFSVGKPKRAGSGMGLSLAQDVVSEHGGTIFVDPSHFDGCRMIVEIPFKRPSDR